MSDSEIILKTTPPRASRMALERERLLRFWNDVQDRTAIAVFAPAGFGKTTLLLQWRRGWMERGALVAWVSADGRDAPARFTRALLQALHGASGRATFEALAAEYFDKPGREIEALTDLMSEVALMGLETVLIIDDAERLPAPTVRHALQYLLLNAPSNLHIVLGARAPLEVSTSELLAKGNFASLDANDLRLRFEESMEILERRLGARLGMDDRARLHEAAEGWPIGLQLAIAAVEHEADLPAAVRALSARRGRIPEYFAESLLSRMSATAADFMVRVAILDYMHAALCEAVTGDPSAGAQLEQLIRETPIMMVDETRGWVRFHPLAREFLLHRFEQLPRDEQTRLHARASHWFAHQDRFHEAARHALAAGDETLAQTYAIRSLWLLGTQGKLAQAREWLDRIPADAIVGDVGLRLVVAGIQAFSAHHAEALQVALTVVEDPTSPPQRRMVALRVAGAATMYADRVDLFARLLTQWPRTPESDLDPIYNVAPLNGHAFLALHAGRTDEVREYVARAATYGNTGTLRLAAAFGLTMVGLSHLWDGNAYLAEAVLRPALAQAEREEGRRSDVAAMYAAVLAAALLEQDQSSAAEALLANRFDVIDAGPPDTVWIAYRTLAWIAASQGDDRRTLDALDALDAVAMRRHLPRLRLLGLAERVRVLAMCGCVDTVGDLLQKLDRLLAECRHGDLQRFLPQCRLAVTIARAHVALARQAPEETERQLAAAEALASDLGRARDTLGLKVLRAVALRHRDPAHARALLAEAITLARIGGNARLMADTHPLAVRMAQELHGPAHAQHGERITMPTDPQTRAAPLRHGLLTAKETEILTLLNKGMSNKLIARTMDISSETVKWHLKNLFLKLSAGTRKHAVDRARLLGLVRPD